MFDYELLEKLEKIGTALERLAEAQIRTSVIEFTKLTNEQKKDYWEAIIDLRENGWSSVFEDSRQQQECDPETMEAMRQELYDMRESYDGHDLPQDDDFDEQSELGQ